MNLKKKIHCPKLIYVVSMSLMVSCQSIKDEYDQRTKQKPVTEIEQLDSVLNSLEMIPYEDLDEDYLSYSDPLGQFDSQLRESHFYVLEGDDVLKYIVGKHRIEEFVTKRSILSKKSWKLSC